MTTTGQDLSPIGCAYTSEPNNALETLGAFYRALHELTEVGDEGEHWTDLDRLIEEQGYNIDQVVTAAYFRDGHIRNKVLNKLRVTSL